MRQWSFVTHVQTLAFARVTSAPACQAVALQKEVAFYGEIRAAIKKHTGEELDIKPYEADMRHLINTYIQADPAADLGELGEMSLTELIIETGIHDAIARKLNEKGKLSKNAIAEGIINNVRKTIIRDQLTDPRFYEQMSKLLDDLIKQTRAARHLRRLLADHLDHGLMELAHHFEIDQRAADVELQVELLADFGGELEDGVLELGAIGPGFFGAIDRMPELLVDHLLDVLETRGGVEFLVDDLAGAFEGDHFRGGDLERAHALGDRRLGDTEIFRGVGLGVTRVEVAVEGVGVDLGVWHRMDLKTEAHLS